MNERGTVHLNRPSREEIAKTCILTTAFQHDIDKHWKSYQRGLICRSPAPEPILRVVHWADLSLNVEPYSHKSQPCERINITYNSNQVVENISSYDLNRRCYVFKGELRLLGVFLDLVEEHLRVKSVKAALLGQSLIYVPMLGVNPGYSRQEFEAKIKIISCVLFVSGPEPRFLEAARQSMRFKTSLRTTGRDAYRPASPSPSPSNDNNDPTWHPKQKIKGKQTAAKKPLVKTKIEPRPATKGRYALRKRKR
ncbi:hypothetical protein CDD82_4156 [Ophiocordyceps australis]|uniref:Uncharacterized protein n=1 Tax=Ophiocordyceps australis TaxID=1399860 RepID=A0A2C5YD85_9HYPO|nr:hypothetical protein CDD82_4156 [Ophiocordyceps australis]